MPTEEELQAQADADAAAEAGSAGGDGGTDSSAETKKTGNDQTVPYARFAEVNRKLRELEAAAAKAQADADAAAEAKMKEDGRLQELVELRSTELAEAKAASAEMEAKYRQATIGQAVFAAAAKAGFTNPEDAAAFLNLDAIEVGEDFQPIGVEDAVKALATERPYLISKPVAPGNTNGPAPAGKGDRSSEEIRKSARQYVRQRF